MMVVQGSRTRVNAIVAFFSWTLFTFLCHWCAKQYVTTRSEDTNFLPNIAFKNAFILTCTQLFICGMVLKPQSTKAINWKVLSVAFVTHFLATFATNCSFALMIASSTLVIKLLEPLMSALLLWCLTGKTVSTTTAISLVLVVTGASGFVGVSSMESTKFYGIVLALISNLFYGLRNICIKHFMDYAPVDLYKGSDILTVFGATAVSFYFSGYNDVTVFKSPASIALISGIAHVTYSYISMFVVLNYLSVVGHAVANIAKRVLVVLVMIFIGQKVITVSNILWLAICTVGLSLYSHEKIKMQKEKGNTYNKPVPSTSPPASTTAHSSDYKPANRPQFTIFYSMTAVIFVFLLVTSSSIYHQGMGHPSNLPKQYQDHPINMESSTRNGSITETYQALFRNIMLKSDSKKLILINFRPADNRMSAITTMGVLEILDGVGAEITYMCYGKQCATEYDNASKFCSQSKPRNTVLVNVGDNTNMTLIQSKFAGCVRIYLFSNVAAVDHRPSSENDIMIFMDNKVEATRDIVNDLKTNFSLPHVGLAIRHIETFQAPVFDVVWLTPRKDAGSLCKTLLGNLSCEARYWEPSSWKGPVIHRNAVESAYVNSYIAFMFLLRGRIVVTENYAGHIASLILRRVNIVLSPGLKVVDSTFNLSYTATNDEEAVKLIKKILNSKANNIPKLSPLMSLW